MRSHMPRPWVVESGVKTTGAEWSLQSLVAIAGKLKF